MVYILLLISSSFLYGQFSADDYFQKGIANYNSNNFQGAITNYNNALELYSDTLYEHISITSWHLVRCYLQLKEYSKGIPVCYSWIYKGGFYIDKAYEFLGLCYWGLEKNSEAIDAFSNAIQKSHSSNNEYQINIPDIYSNIKYNYQSLGNSYGWIPTSQFWKVNIPHGYWKLQDHGKTCCIQTFAFRVENKLPISIEGINIDLIIKDKKGTIVYKRNHTAWVNGLKTNEVAQSDYFDLNNEVCLPCSYLNSDKFSWTTDITGVAY